MRLTQSGRQNQESGARLVRRTFYLRISFVHERLINIGHAEISPLHIVAAESSEQHPDWGNKMNPNSQPWSPDVMLICVSVSSRLVYSVVRLQQCTPSLM